MIRDLKLDVKQAIIDDNSEAIDASIFFYRNGDINWFATDFLMSKNVTPSSKGRVKGNILFFLGYLDEYKNWKDGSRQSHPIPVGNVTDEHIYDYVDYIEEKLGLDRNAIVSRLRDALKFLQFIQDNYQLDYSLLAITSESENGLYSKVKDGQVNAEWRYTKYNQKYLHHAAMPHTENYPTRYPITTDAIESLYDDLDMLEESGNVYAFELLSMLMELLESTGARVSEIAPIDIHTIELLRMQVNAANRNVEIDFEEIIRINQLTIDRKKLAAAEAIYNNANIYQTKGKLTWLKIGTTKGKHNGKVRIVPIPFLVAQKVVKFYDDYIVNEKDRIAKGLSPVNRVKFNRLLVHPNSHLPMSNSMISSYFYEIFTRKYKSKHKRHPHLFRHRYITLLVFYELKKLQVNMGSYELAKLILKRISVLTGHASVTTMMYYVNIAYDWKESEEKIESDSNVPFDDITRKHLIEKFGENEVAEMEKDILAKKAAASIASCL
ncbi:site-specific integrase [Vibrio parahaemolyticus]|nr:site-specific integrase [Vibrio parahaemolyticus]ELC0707657.1 site-specific integrase [Vibrio parahaemolyticus]MBM5053492.1 site-specific integrase [Vibrio parahaemolyticus]